MQPGSTQPLNILIVEDSIACMALMQALLSKAPIPVDRVAAAVSLTQAFELLDSIDFDVVLLDLNLPDSKGFDTVLKLTRKYPSIAVVVVTAEHDGDTGLNVVAAGAQEYLVKGKNCTTETVTKSVYYAIERKRTQEMLDRKQRNHEAIFDASPVGMLLIDEDLTVLRVNRVIQQMTGKKYAQLLKQHPGNALGCVNSTISDKGCGHSDMCGMCDLRKTVVQAFNSGKAVQGIEINPTIETDTGQTSPWLWVSADLVMIDDRKCVLLAIDDITERKQAEAKLQETMALKAQFISTVSHELRTPLAAIKESVGIVSEGVAGKLNKEQKKFLDMAKRNVDRLADLINDVLDFQKLEAGKMELNFQSNDIAEVVREVHQTMILAAKKNNVELSYNCAEPLIDAEFDRNKMIQVLTNLISNAIKFTPAKGTVSVNVTQANEELIIDVIDTGMGIPKEDLPKIFERFYRVQRPGTQIKGTGLGLAIVSRIVRMHDGRIEPQSQVGKGTTFTVILPLKQAPVPVPLTNS